MGRPSSGRDPRVALQGTRPRPNMRLKLAGGDRSKRSRVFVRWRAQTHVYYSCAGERVARSLSAIR